MIPLRPIVHRILEDYALPWHGIHGVGHWTRVLENGLRLAKETKANVEIVQLFAIFHDSCRVNEGADFGHGRRGAELAAKLRGRLFDLGNTEFRLLYEACAGHTDGLTKGDVTIQTCWDADRLDLGRVRMYPEPKKLCTEVTKQAEIINWAGGRGAFGVVPGFVKAKWGIDLEGSNRKEWRGSGMVACQKYIWPGPWAMTVLLVLKR